MWWEGGGEDGEANPAFQFQISDIKWQKESNLEMCDFSSQHSKYRKQQADVIQETDFQESG